MLNMWVTGHKELPVISSDGIWVHYHGNQWYMSPLKKSNGIRLISVVYKTFAFKLKHTTQTLIAAHQSTP
jgi:hypothetical protein